MSSEDYESAAEHIAMFMALEARLSSAMVAAEGPAIEEQKALLMNAKAALEEVGSQRRRGLKP